MSRERSKGAFSKLDVIVDFDEAPIQAVGEEARDEERQIADFAESVALTAAAGLQRAGEADTERLS